MPTYLAGKTGWLKSGNTSYSMREWRLEMSASQVDVTNFTSGGFSEFLVGFITGSLTTRGPMDAANQFTVGNAYTVNVGMGNNYYTTFSGLLMRVSASTAVDQAGMVDLEFKTNGSFNTTFAV